MMAGRLWRMVTVPRMIVVLVVVAVIAATLVTVHVPSARQPGAGILAPGSQGSLSQPQWWDPRGWFSSGPQASSSHVVPGTEAALSSPARVLREAKTPPLRRVRELAAKRTEFSRTYELSDGRQQAVISSVPASYQDTAGRWEPVNTTVTRSRRPGFGYQNVTNTFGSYFGADPARLVRFEVAGEGWLQVGLAGARQVTPRVAADVVTYPGILPGVSLSYQVTPTELVERIVLASPAAGGALRFTVRAGGGLKPAEMPDGGIAWSPAATGVPVLTIPAPFMTDSRGVRSAPLERVWTPVTQHSSWDAASSVLTQTLAPDRGWLSAAGRVFPVTVDPTIEVSPTPSQAQNVMISSDNPTTNYNSSSWPMEVGTTTTGAARSLVSFPLTSIPSGTQIDTADLNLYWDQSFGPGTANQTVNAYQATSSWSAPTVTWSTGPSVGTEGMNQVLTDDSDTTDTSASGTWPSQADSNAISGEYLYDQDSTAGDTFTWAPQLTEAGTYKVEDHYVANTAAASNAPFTVNYNGGSKTFTVNQQSGTAGMWKTLGSEPFAAGNTGTVVLGDGPASTSVRVEADEVRLTKYGSVTDVPASGGGQLAGNKWDSFAVRNIVRSWLNGSAANDGFVLEAANESTLNAGGPMYERSGNFYNGETTTYPQLVVTYGAPAVTLNPITTIAATGANLSWTPYVNTTGDPGKDLAEYQVYRSVNQSFTPSPDTLVSPVPAGTTSFDDTTATPAPAGASTGNAQYYMVAVKTQDGTIVPGATQLVLLPVAGHTTVILPATGTATLAQAQPATNLQSISGQPWLETGNNSATFGVTRSVFSFPALSSAIPAGSTITDAHMKLWGWDNVPGGAPSSAIYEVQNLTQSFSPAQVTWNSASAGTAWGTAGGAFDSGTSSVMSGGPMVGASSGAVTGLTSDPGEQDFAVTSIAQGWLDTPSSQSGLLLKLAGETSTDPQDQELWLNTSATEPSLAPALVVTYLTTTPADTYYAPDTPQVSAAASSYTTDVTVTNTTAATWNASDWVLSYHWLTPDGTEVTTSADQAQTALPSDLAPGAQATLTATVETPDSTGTGNARTGYQLLWDMFDKTTGTWLSSGTATPNLTGNGGAGTVGPLGQVTSAAETAETLGLEKYFQYTGVDTGSGSVLENNDATGNTVWNYNPFSNPSRGFQTFVRLDYNSMDTSESSMGFGWSLQASTLTRLGTPLDFHPKGNVNTVTLTDGNGGSHAFTLNTTVTPPVWTSPPGFHYFLQSYAACNKNGKDNPAKAWLITAPDRTQFFFDCDGFQTAVVDKNGNEADFTYAQRKSENKPEKFLDYITDPSGRQTLTISYYTKGQTYSYVDDTVSPPQVISNVANLTNPDIIDQVQSITDVSGRQITFLYDKEGLMAQMTDGAGTSVAKVFSFGYDPTQGNKNVKLVSVTDPRGDATSLAFYPPSASFKWALNTVTDRRQHTTTWTYGAQTGGGVQTAVTDPVSHTTTYLIDSTGRPVKVTNPMGFNTQMTWDTDNNLASLQEDNGATVTWTWDPNTGYPLTRTGAQANHDGTAGYTYGYQFSLSGHVADFTSELTPQQRLWTFGYDSFGNLTSVTKPLGNVSGAAAGSYTTSYKYNPDGTLATSTDPDGNTTTYSAYGPTGYPGAVKDARGNTTSYLYSPTGSTTSVTDAYGNPTTQQYDIFGRPGQETIPKTSSQTITIAAPVYDGNDNVTTSYAPSYTSTPGPATNYTYNADDQLNKLVAPADNANSPSPTTTYVYNADNTLHLTIRPKGNVSGATASQFTTTYAYNPDQTLKSATDALGDVTKYAYDDVSNKVSVTDPDGNPTQYQYNLDHQVTQVTDAAGNTTMTGYDLDGLTTSVTNPNNDTTLYTLDADGQITQQKVPAQAPGAPVTYDVTQYAYDQVGNRTQLLTPRAIAAGFSLSSSCVSTPTTNPCPDTWVTGYNADNTIDSQQSPANAGDPVYPGPQTTTYTHDKDDRISKVTLPSSNDSLSVPNTTTNSYFDNGWLSSSIDPRGVTTAWDYNAYGEQSSRTLENSGVTEMNRSESWQYYPDGKLQSLADTGVPTGLNAELVDNTDGNASSSPSGSWPSTSCTSGCDGYSYQANSSGSGTFTWHLDIPAAGSYTVYVKYPRVSGAATGAAYKVTHSGTTTSLTVNQTQNTGTWVTLGKWTFSASGTGQQVTLTANSSGTAIANAVKAVRDSSSTSNSANNAYNYSYDPDGNLTGVTTTNTTISSTGPTTTTTGSDTAAYDQLDRISSVQENDGSGTEQHLTSYTFDPAANLKTLTHANGAPPVTDQYSTYNYDNLNKLQNETDGTSTTDPSPKVSIFAYTPTGQLATEVKPNNGNTIANPAGNLVTDTYNANDQLHSQTEYTNDSTTTGTLVSSHTYKYDQNGNQTQDIEKLMSADSSANYLSHTLNYTYNPLDQLATVTTDGTQTEQYSHDPEGDVLSQTIGSGASAVTTSYNYDRGLLETSTSGGITAFYNYDPLGRLDTVTSGSPGGSVLETNTYDGFDNLTGHTQLTSSGTTSTKYVYDPLKRLVSQTATSGTTSATTNYSYLGLTSELAQEADPGNQTKNYSYTPTGLRLFQTTTSSTGTVTPGYYTYNNHSDVEAVTGTNGNTTATYGYTAYGANITSMFTGADKGNTQPGSITTPYNSYRYNAMRWDPGSGQYDMGFRNYDSGLNSFISRDMYDGALADVSLTSDPFTGSRYAFGGGNPISNIELDGHMFPAGGGAAGCPSSLQGCPGYTAPRTSGSSSSSGCGFLGLGCLGHAISSGLNRASNWLGSQANNLAGGILNGITDTANFIGTPFRWLGAKLANAMPTGVTANGHFIFTNHATDKVAHSPFHIGNQNSLVYKAGYYGWPLLFPPAEGDEVGASAGAAATSADAGSGAAIRVFWNGGDAAKAAATKFAMENGGQTIGMTPEGQALEVATDGMPYEQSRPLWEAGSKSFADGASGPVHVFIATQASNPEGVWQLTELPALVENTDVTDVYFHLIRG